MVCTLTTEEKGRKSNQTQTVDALVRHTDEGRTQRRNLLGRSYDPMIQQYPNGATHSNLLEDPHPNI